MIKTVITLIIIAILAALGFSTLNSSSLSAQAAVTNPPATSSNVLLQNTTGTPANVNVQIYIPDNGAVVFSQSFQIAPKGSRTLHAGAGSSDTGHLYMNLTVPSSSMTISSDQKVVATNINFGSPSSHNIYESLSSADTSTDILVPSIHWRDTQWTKVGIQNAGASATGLQIQYFRQDGSLIKTIPISNLAVGASHIRYSYNDIGISTEPSGVGSMRVTSTNGQKLAVSAIETLGAYTSSYDGTPLSSADTLWNLPSVHRNPAGQFSHILAQNTENFTATVTLTYFNQSGGQVDQFTNISIPPKGSLTFHTTSDLSSNGQNYTPTNLGNVGAARITSTTPANAKLVVSVLETVGSSPYGYNGINSQGSGTLFLLPSIHRNPGGQFSHTLVQNISSNPNSITITYFNQNGSVANSFNKTLSGSGSLTFHTDGSLSGDGINYTPTNLVNVGSAQVQSTSGLPLVTVVIETISGIPAAYTGFKIQ